MDESLPGNLKPWGWICYWENGVEIVVIWFGPTLIRK